MPLPLPLLCLVTDRALCGDRTLEEVVGKAVAGGVDLVQVRERDLPAGELLALVRQIRQVAEGRALTFVNDRLDVALAAGADGVHLPEAGLPVREARALARDRLLIGRSVHSVEAGIEAAREGADLLQLGAIYPTASHPGRSPAGVAMLAQLAARVDAPVVGVGGITTGNAGEAMAAGAAGVAVIRAILTTRDPQRAAQELRKAVMVSWDARHGKVVS